LLRYRWAVEAGALKGDVTCPLRRSLRGLLFKHGLQTADEAGYWNSFAQVLQDKYPGRCPELEREDPGPLLREIWVGHEEPRIRDTRPFAWLEFDELLA
jgi:hypothetical protein